MSYSQVVTFSSDDVVEEELTELSLSLEQEPIPIALQQANFDDLYQMKSYIRSGLTAYDYIRDICTYVVIKEDSITVTLPFYVWPSTEGLNYTLKSDNGTVSTGEQLAEYKDFDVAFSGTDSYVLPYLFKSAILTPQMPFYTPEGALTTAPTYTFKDLELRLSESIYQVYRLMGQAHGFKHNAIIRFERDPEDEAFKITELSCSITATWDNEEGEVQTEILDLEIPSCVEALLAYCPDGTSIKGEWKCTANCKYLLVYINTCSGDDLGSIWVDKLAQ